MNVRRLIPAAALSTTVVLGLGALTACSDADAGSGRKDGKLDVVASFYPMQYLAERIGAGHVSVRSLTKPGVEPHDLELSPRQTASLGRAGLVVYLKGVQPAVDKAIAQSGAEHTVDAATLTKLEDHGTEVGHGHEGEEHHGESEAGADPHVWLDPVKYAEVARGVGKALEKADPDNAADYEKNTAALVKDLGALNEKFAAGLRTTATKTFITTHSAFGYLAERYGLTQEGIAGIDPEAEPSPARVKELQSIARKDHVDTVFFETLASDKTARTLAGDTGLKTDVLDPLEGITDKSRGEDYLQVMESNLAALRKALGAK
ncbi:MULTISPECIES: metal ABC transporter substrate-binding protein [unclassified Streptomyces]|uniref:metal ABC transporter substrate-binding protein n=1 Tax=unclassified Streptomyces TaxID=2593676 RepID=UPI0033D53024